MCAYKTNPNKQAKKPIKTQKAFYEPYEGPKVGTRWAPPDDSPYGHMGYYY